MEESESSTNPQAIIRHRVDPLLTDYLKRRRYQHRNGIPSKVNSFYRLRVIRHRK